MGTTADRTRIAARLIIGAAAAAAALGLNPIGAAAGPVGPTDVVACPTQGMAHAGIPTLVSPVSPRRATLAPLPTQTATVLPDPTIVLPPPVGDPEPTGQTFTAAPKEEPGCGSRPTDPTEPTNTDEAQPEPGDGDPGEPGDDGGVGDPGQPGDDGDGSEPGTPAADTGDLAYTGVGAGAMVLGGVGLLGGGGLVLLLVRRLSRRVG